MTELLRKHQLAMLDMLEAVDHICKKHRISYQLFAGTALGAVRHQGFIPWDDDLDVIMLRSDYERFMKIAPQELEARFFLQKEFSEHWPMFFSKLRLNNTTALEKYHVRDKKIHQGIYIDIFPCDNLSDNHYMRKLQFIVSKVIIAKSLYSRGYETDNRGKKLFMQLCRMFPRKPLHMFCILCREKNSEMVHTFFGASSRYEKSIYPREWFSNTKSVIFEGKEYPVSIDVEEMLKSLYGDYMRLPAPEERKCKTHVAFLDLEQSYTEYLEMQKTMKFDGFTRSIR